MYVHTYTDKKEDIEIAAADLISTFVDIYNPFLLHPIHVFFVLSQGLRWSGFSTLHADQNFISEGSKSLVVLSFFSFCSFLLTFALEQEVPRNLQKISWVPNIFL